jgi:anti-sigma-K factor RskA
MMKGVAKSPESMAMVYWNTESKEVFIELKSLPVPEEGKQYQLWAIVDGKPVDAGMITLSEEESSLHRMKDFESAQAFAITLEKQGGSPTPTLSEMYVMGSVGS